MAPRRSLGGKLQENSKHLFEKLTGIISNAISSLSSEVATNNENNNEDEQSNNSTKFETFCYDGALHMVPKDFKLPTLDTLLMFI